MQHLMPMLAPVSFLCHQKWESQTKLKIAAALPMLFLSGGQDTLVPVQHMQYLYNTARLNAGDKSVLDDESKDDYADADGDKKSDGDDNGDGDKKDSEKKDADGDSGEKKDGDDAATATSTSTSTAAVRSRKEKAATKAQQKKEFEAKSKHIWWREFPHGQHNTTVMQPGYFDAIGQFLKEVAPASAAPFAPVPELDTSQVQLTNKPSVETRGML
ncbi:hypothetical protein GQ42DRAFT_77075 [Ramicandelaber brevisporus]|nr:hypothetical protein GQ42DRAFT_77075 [Ramicandelaber brevisporus]